MTFVLVVIILGLIAGLIMSRVQLTKTREMLKTSTSRALEADVPMAITSARHKLERTFHDRRITTSNNKGQDFHGWNYICTCGTVAPALDNYGGFGDGSEQGAVKAFIQHRALYALSVEAGENEVEELKKQLKEQEDNCICKDLK